MFSPIISFGAPAHTLGTMFGGASGAVTASRRPSKARRRPNWGAVALLVLLFIGLIGTLASHKARRGHGELQRLKTALDREREHRHGRPSLFLLDLSRQTCDCRVPRQ